MTPNTTPLQTPPVKTGPMNRAAKVVKPKNMKGTLHRLFVLTSGHRQGLWLIFLFSGLVSLTTMLSPYLIGRTIDQITIGSPSTTLLVLLTIVYLGSTFLRFLQGFLMASTGQRIIAYVRKELFSVMKTLPLSFFDKNQHGDLMSRLTNDIDTISSTISDSLTQLMMMLFTIIGLLGIMLYLNVWLTLVSLFSLPLMYLLTRTVTKHTRKLFKQQQQVLGTLGGHIEESISGINLVKAFGQEEQVIDQFELSNELLRKVATTANIWSGFLMPLMNVINNLSFILLSTVSGIMATKGLISIGLISTFLLYSKQFARPIIDLTNIYNTFQTAVAGAERIFDIMDEPPEPKDKEDAIPLPSLSSSITFDHVTFSYTPDTVVLKDLSFTIPSGTKAAIVGSTGSGKTTIISLLTRLYDVTSGNIYLDGHDLRDYRLSDLRKHFGVVLQDTSLFELSVLENIRYGRETATNEEIIAAAKSVGAHNFIKKLSHGYDTILDENGSNLSQGERQLITIARAMLADAPILILDEATSSVDTRTEQKIRDALLKLTKDRTSFLIAHRLSTIRDSDLIILLEDGQIAEMGSHDELMKLDGIYATMYHTQLGISHE